MVCPNCNTEQVESFECVKCGIVFAKWSGHQVRARDREQAGWTRPAGRTTRVIRVLVGVVLVALAVLSYLNGAAMKAFGPYVALVLFAGGGLYLLVSVRERVSVLRFAVEAGLAAVIAGSMFLALPDVFSLGKPLYKSSIGALPSGEAIEFLRVARAQAVGLRAFLQASDLPDGAAAEALVKPISPEAVVRAFQAIPERDRPLAQAASARLQGLYPLFDPFLRRVAAEVPKGPAAWIPGAVLADLRQKVSGLLEDLDAADRKVSQAFADAAAAAAEPAR